MSPAASPRPLGPYTPRGAAPPGGRKLQIFPGVFPDSFGELSDFWIFGQRRTCRSARTAPHPRGGWVGGAAVEVILAERCGPRSHDVAAPVIIWGLKSLMTFGAFSVKGLSRLNVTASLRWGNVDGAARGA
eukprot:1656873-Pyramimonas_sp.AAC.1